MQSLPNLKNNISKGPGSNNNDYYPALAVKEARNLGNLVSFIYVGLWPRSLLFAQEIAS